jgi:hypothetical protein
VKPHKQLNINHTRIFYSAGKQETNSATGVKSPVSKQRFLFRYYIQTGYGGHPVSYQMRAGDKADELDAHPTTIQYRG